MILPVSRVSFGLCKAALTSPIWVRRGGRQGYAELCRSPAFGGGSGAGISVSPVAFLVVRQNEVRLMPVDSNAIYDRLLDLAPKLLDQLQGAVTRREYTEKPAWAYDSGGRNNL